MPRTTPPPEPVAPNPEPMPARIELDAWSFNAAERHECQVQFDSEFGDLLEYLFRVVRPTTRWTPVPVLDAEGKPAVDERGEPVVRKPTGPVDVAIVDRNGRRYFADEILSFMCWVQAKRTRPDADLAEFSDVVIDELTTAHLVGLVKKATGGTGTSKRRPSAPAS